MPSSRAGQRVEAGTAAGPHCSGKLCCGALLLILAAVFCYANTFGVPFLFDDNNAILDNPHVRSLPDVGEALQAPEQSTVAGRPVVSLSLALNYSISMYQVWSYHLLNLLIHICAGLALFGVVHRTLALNRFSGGPGRYSREIALAAALLWITHPVHTEAVTYVSTRTESMMGMFYILSLYCIIRGAGRSWSHPWNLAGVFSCALAMGSKEVAVTAPVLILLHDGLFISQGVGHALRRRPAVYGLLAATWLILIVLTATAPRGETAGFAQSDVTPLEYGLTQLTVIPHYLRLLVWPHPLVLDYGWPVLPSLNGAALAGGLFLALLLGASLWLLRQGRKIGYLGIWFFLILAPSSSIVPIATEVAAERRVYLPSMAAAVLAALGIWWVAERLVRRSRRHAGRPTHGARGPVGWVVVGLAAAAGVALGLATHSRNSVYASEVGIWEETAAHRPGNARAWENLGSALARTGQRDQAEPHFRRALELNPGSYRAAENLGLILLDRGETEKSVENLARAAALRPKDGVTRLNLANALRAAGRPGEAAGELQVAADLMPGDPLPRARLGLILIEMGRADEAAIPIRDAQALDPQNLVVQQAARELALHTGDVDTAMKALEAGRQSGTPNPDSLYNLGLRLIREGREAEGVQYLREAVRLRPVWTDALNKLALALASARDPSVQDPAEAVRIAQGLVEATGGKHPLALATLGVAQASAGDRAGSGESLDRARAVANQLENKQIVDHVAASESLSQELLERRAQEQ